MNVNCVRCGGGMKTRNDDDKAPTVKKLSSSEIKKNLGKLKPKREK